MRARQPRASGCRADEIRELAATPDILSLGMLADALRRRLHGTRVDVPARRRVRVRSLHRSTPCRRQGARDQDHRLAGAARGRAVGAVEVVKAWAIARCRAFTWADVERMAAGDSVAERARAAARAPASTPRGAAARRPGRHRALIVSELAAAGFTQLRLTIDKARRRTHATESAAACRGAAGSRSAAFRRSTRCR